MFWFKAQMHPAALAFMRLLAAMDRPALSDASLPDVSGPAPGAAQGLISITITPRKGAPIPV